MDAVVVSMPDREEIWAMGIIPERKERMWVTLDWMIEVKSRMGPIVTTSLGAL